MYHIKFSCYVLWICVITSENACVDACEKRKKKQFFLSQVVNNYISICKMHNSAILQISPLSEVFLCSCDKVFHKQEVRFLLYLLGQLQACLNTIALTY